MYSVVAASQRQILDLISADELKEYEWLCENPGLARANQYQQRYRSFWGMNRASSAFCRRYFEILEAGTTGDLPGLLRELENPSMRRNGTPTVQFSFATKLLHTRDAQLPLYDSRVARFFLFEPPSGGDRMPRLIAFYRFLASEYARIINGGHLADAISAFRQRFKPLQHRDEKIIDWLIWAFVGLADDGALLERRIAFK